MKLEVLNYENGTDYHSFMLKLSRYWIIYVHSCSNV